jgi:acyl-CoA reductase-like NAD-dependent aldehyde dehydrogenase
MVSEKLIYSVNPATEEILGSYRIHSEEQIEAVLQQSQKTFVDWRTHPMADRSQLMKEAAKYLRQNKTRFAALMTQEMGKPIVESEGEIEKCALNCDFLRRQRRTIFTKGIARFQRHGKLYPIYAIGSDSRDHAVELSFLAGISICRASVDGRKYCRSQTCIQCASMRLSY